MDMGRDPTSDAPQLRIVAAALRHQGKIYSVPAPARHGDVMNQMYDTLGHGPEAQHDQGFVTSAGDYVDRQRAWTIAVEAGQLLERAPTDHRGGTLYSEDVW